MKALSRSLLLAVFILLLSASCTMASVVGYTFDITTNYQFGGCSSSGLYCASPDTGFLTVTNNGASTFTGNLDLSGGVKFDDSLTSITLAPGGSFVFASGTEGSNVGGFNAPDGAIFTMTGTVGGSEFVILSVNDGDIHSGVPRTSPCDGVLTDAFVLQGGSPTGCDNGDSFETTQANGHFEFFEAGPATTPEPASLLLMGTGLLSLCGIVRRKFQA